MKKIFAAILLCLLTVSGISICKLQTKTETLESDSVLPGIYGDINNDGEVTLEDAQLSLQIALRIKNSSESEKKVMDVDGNGKLDDSKGTGDYTKRILFSGTETGNAC